MSMLGNYSECFKPNKYTDYLHYRACYKLKLSFKEYLKNHQKSFEDWNKLNRLKKYNEYLKKVKK